MGQIINTTIRRHLYSREAELIHLCQVLMLFYLMYKRCSLKFSAFLSFTLPHLVVVSWEGANHNENSNQLVSLTRGSKNTPWQRWWRRNWWSRHLHLSQKSGNTSVSTTVFPLVTLPATAKKKSQKRTKHSPINHLIHFLNIYTFFTLLAMLKKTQLLMSPKNNDIN